MLEAPSSADHVGSGRGAPAGRHVEVSMTATRWYLAGPMTGYQALNFPEFNRHTARLRALGYEVINPAEINTDPNADWSACMRTDIAQLVRCDGIALLSGWQLSRGALLEHRIAKALGMRIALAWEITERAEVEIA